jgi:hypothetical protein
LNRRCIGGEIPTVGTAALDRDELLAPRDPPDLQRAVQRQVEGLDVDRLVQVVERAGLHGEDGRRHVVVRGDHQDGRLGGALPQLGDEIEARGVRQPHVEHDGRGARLLRQAEAFRAGRGRGDAEAPLLEVHAEQLADRPIVVHDEDAIHGRVPF